MEINESKLSDQLHEINVLRRRHWILQIIVIVITVGVIMGTLYNPVQIYNNKEAEF